MSINKASSQVSIKDRTTGTLAEVVTRGDTTKALAIDEQIEFKLKKVDVVNTNITYEGRTFDFDAADADAVWQIKKIETVGDITTHEFANDAAYDQVWDNRESLLPALGFVNTNSLLFDGVDESMSCGNDATTEKGVDEALSISVWVRADVTQNTLATICGNYDGQGYRIYFQDNAGQDLSFQFRTATVPTREIVVSTTTEIMDDTWHHVVVTYDGSATAAGVTMYIDGSSVSLNTDSDDADATGGKPANSFTFAATPLGTRFYTGYIDEASTYNDVLTAGEVSSIYNGGVPIDLTGHDHIEHWWKMGEGSTFPTIDDEVGSLNGTMTNMESGDITTEVPTA